MTTLGNDIGITLQSIISVSLCRELGTPEPDAARIAATICGEISTALHGEKVYFTEADMLEKRNATIRAEWRGNNLTELMSRWQLSRTSIYRILGEGK